MVESKIEINDILYCVIFGGKTHGLPATNKPHLGFFFLNSMNFFPSSDRLAKFGASDKGVQMGFEHAASR